MIKKILQGVLFSLLPLLLVSGCSSIGDKNASISIVYLITTFFSALMLAGYCFAIKKKEKWFLILFISVLIVNAGYFTLSISDTLGMALTANRISYLGSVFLPLSMLMIIMNVSKLQYKKCFPYILGTISVIIFLIAASPGYLNIYYKSVTLENIGGVSVLNKEYGSWHCLYLFYLMIYFIIMISSIVHAIIQKKLDSLFHAIILLVAVFVNICVWLLEQLVKIDFEFLSISYIISELFLISVYLMIEHHESLILSLQSRITSQTETEKTEITKTSDDFIEHCSFIIEQLPTLTSSERKIYDLYLEGKSTKEILSELSITENTLKFHNKNIYGKLGVSSRKKLIEYSKAISKTSK